MSRKLKRLIEEEEKTLSRIAEQQEFLKEIREVRKKEEDLEIIRSIRGMKLGARELLDLLTGIQKGTISMEMRQSLLERAEDEEDADGAGREMIAEAGADEAGGSAETNAKEEILKMQEQDRAGADRNGPEREEDQ